MIGVHSDPPPGRFPPSACKCFGIDLVTRETLPIFRQESTLEGQLGHSCPTSARCQTHTGSSLDSKVEFGSGPVSTPPEPFNGEEVLRIVEDINYIWGLKNGGSVGENDGDRVCGKKKSKFFDLDIIGTLLEIPGKNKDGIAAWLDLLNMGVKNDLQPKYGERRTRLPPGPWNLSKAKKRAVCNSFYGMKFPEDSRLLGLKSHDCHTLMQQLLPVAIRSILEKPARYMKVLKGSVQNRARPKGCIAEREHMIYIKTTYPNFRKRTKWLQDKHNSTFIQWLHFKVQSELNREEHNGVSENLRWLAAGPSMAVPSYRSYLINGVKFNTKAQDDVQTVQNSGVYLLAHT
ncbi:hypothetical protein Prudu_776S000200, partial [Prunus dulcis]